MKESILNRFKVGQKVRLLEDWYEPYEDYPLPEVYAGSIGEVTLLVPYTNYRHLDRLYVDFGNLEVLVYESDVQLVNEES